MRVYNSTAQVQPDAMGAVLTIGNFDGVHLGHMALVKEVLSRARKLNRPSAAMTFHPHPVTVVAPDKAPPLINSMDERINLLEEAGLDILVIEKFDKDFSALSPEDFARKVLFENIRPAAVIVGFNYGFGKGRSGGVDVLEMSGQKLGFEVVVVPPVMLGDLRVSSTGIRRSVENGDLNKAAKLLGRPFFVSGKVKRGAGRGATLGFPTANLFMEPRLLPPLGVYACMALLRDKKWPAAVHLGPAPTFGVPYTVEAHLIGFDGGDLYGRNIKLEFYHYVRGI
ncbi:MAG: riboflavin biosynthesis protein RibF, partial [Deltaproteobacteria bacterium]|nr:riboflavin biosynthesis protein RibF [Deltaproteobacteria bacterium]